LAASVSPFSTYLMGACITRHLLASAGAGGRLNFR
jgi:hypothetical protein